MRARPFRCALLCALCLAVAPFQARAQPVRNRPAIPGIAPGGGAAGAAAAAVAAPVPPPQPVPPPAPGAAPPGAAPPGGKAVADTQGLAQFETGIEYTP